MIERVPIFASLDAFAVLEVGRSLSAVVALPGEKVIAVGQPADAMYFIAAGEVAVHVGGNALHAVTLKEGSFFGEMGLLDSQPRNSDVVSIGYCHLLALYRRDFNRLLTKRPELRAAIEAVAAQRVPDASG
jgi:CRP-like cAMP-binding protein